MKTCVFVTRSIRSQTPRIPGANELFLQLKEQGVELHIHAYKEPDFEDTTPEIPILAPHKATHSGLAVLRGLLAVKPSVVLVGGYGDLANWVALIYAKLKRIPIVFWGSGSDVSIIHSGSVYRWLKSFFLKKMNHILTYGNKTTEFYQSLGIDRSMMTTCQNVSDTSYFKSELVKYIDEHGEPTQGDRPLRFIFAGRLVPRKGIDLLLSALKELPKDAYECWFLGDGVLRPLVEEAVEDPTMSVSYFGKCSRDIVASKIIQSDVFVMPTRQDQFSRVTSEVLSCGCFMVTSINDDAAYDLIEEGKNGLVIDPKTQLVETLKTLVKNPPQYSKLDVSNSLKETVASYSEKISKSILAQIT